MTAILSSGAARRCKPMEEWPQWDRQCWQAALQAGDLLEEGGCRAEHSQFSNRAMEKGYGRWLAWLDSRHLLDAQAAPGDRITPDRVRAYAGHLEAENASGTAIARLMELKVTAAIMDRGRDWSWIYRMAPSIRARHKPARPKRHRLVPIERLFSLGLDLMARAEVDTTPLRRFRTYRDGLMIGLLASRPLRLRNLTGLILDGTLVQRGDLWWIQIPAAETKTKSPIELPWPDILVPHLGTYLVDHRSAIAALRRTETATGALWLSMHGLPMNDTAIYIRIVTRTREGLGQAINPHLFRDCAATSIAIGRQKRYGKPEPSVRRISRRIASASTHRNGPRARRPHRPVVGSAASRDRIWVIDSAANIVATPRQKGFLHETARFDTARLVIIAFRR
jgi:integrase/recombinase XerD